MSGQSSVSGTITDIECSAIFQAGGLLVVLVEVHRKSFLASIVPVIVNCILNEHQLIADIVAFVAKGLFPRSRLGEKQRGKILASWVTRKMETLAQFGIRDPDAVESAMTAVPEDRPHGPSSLRHASVAGSDVSRADNATIHSKAPAARAFDGSHDASYAEARHPSYESSILESPPGVTDATHDTELTPTDARGAFYDGPPTARPPPHDYFSADGRRSYDSESTPQPPPEPHRPGGAYLGGFEPQGPAATTSPMAVSPQPPPPRPPAKDEPARTYVAYQPGSRSASSGSRPATAESEEWPQEALKHMRHAGI